MKKIKKRLYVEVSCGIVTGIYTDSNEAFDVVVIDRDVDEDEAIDFDPKFAEIINQAAAEIENDKTLIPVY